jgi:hypothetical protein
VLGAGHSGPVIARVPIDAGYPVSVGTSGGPADIELIAGRQRGRQLAARRRGRDIIPAGQPARGAPGLGQHHHPSGIATYVVVDEFAQRRE